MAPLRLYSIRAFFALLVLQWRRVSPANWAQTTGLPQQNIVVTSNPGPSLPNWSGREGLAVTVAQAVENVSITQVFLLGGDDGTVTYDVTLLIGSGGVRNDVWTTTSAGWAIEHPTVDQASASVRSTMRWTEINVGQLPPFTVRYKEWIQCSDALLIRPNQTIGVLDPFYGIAAVDVDCAYDPLTQGSAYTEPKKTQLPAIWKESLMFSPRRFHQAVYHAETLSLWVLGGEARDGADMAQEKQHRRESSAPTPWREELVLKNDVWFSSDSGAHWTLANPGTDPEVFQRSFLNEFVSPQHVPESTLCTGSSGCYGSADCTRDDELDGVCISSIWSPRKHHRAIGFGSYLYVLGGFALISQGVCGPYGCSNHQRIALDDVWRADLSKPWVNLGWKEMKRPSATTATNSWKARGRFGLAMMNLYGSAATWALSQVTAGAHELADAQQGLQCLWIIGGEGNQHDNLFNDTWLSFFNEEDVSASIWIEYTLAQIPWGPRAGHVVGVEPPSSQNNYLERMIIHGGVGLFQNFNGGHALVHEQTWSWGPRCESLYQDGQSGYDGRICARKQMTSSWVPDYSAEAWYKLRTRLNGDSSCLLYSNGTPPDYCLDDGVTRAEATGPETPQQFYVDAATQLDKLYQTFLPGSLQADFLYGTAQERRSSSGHGATVTRVPLFLPHEVEVMAKLSVSTVQDLAQADLMTILRLQGYAEGGQPLQDICKKKALCQEIVVKCGAPISEIKVEIDWEHELSRCANEGLCAWDGCTLVNDQLPVEIRGIGFVKQAVAFDEDNMIDEFHCKVNPGARVDHAAFILDNNFHVAGGRVGHNSHAADTWYRDDRLPSTTIIDNPSPGTADTTFKVVSDEEGVMHQCQLYDKRASQQVLRWSAFSESSIQLDVLTGANPEWMQVETKSKYTFWARGVDPAGNPDPTFYSKKGSRLNMYSWKFSPPAPWALISVIISTTLLFIALLYHQFLKYKKADALRRYALRRLRRRMKYNLMANGKLDFFEFMTDAHAARNEKNNKSAPTPTKRRMKIDRSVSAAAAAAAAAVTPPLDYVPSRAMTRKTSTKTPHKEGAHKPATPSSASLKQKRGKPKRSESQPKKKAQRKRKPTSPSPARAPKKKSSKVQAISTSSRRHPNSSTKDHRDNRARSSIKSHVNKKNM